MQLDSSAENLLQINCSFSLPSDYWVAISGSFLGVGLFYPKVSETYAG